MLLFSSCEMMVAPGKGIMESSYELARLRSFRSTLDFSPSPLAASAGPWPPSGQSASWSMACGWLMRSSRVSLARAKITLPATVLFTPMSTRRRLVCLVSRAALS